MRSEWPSVECVVGVVDALGAAVFERDQINHFLNARARILEATESRAEVKLPEVDRFITFTFNDTIVIVLKSQGNSERSTVSAGDARAFMMLLRSFFVESLKHGIFFRGAVSIAPCIVDHETNTVMGEAVADAASWYEQADWIGVLLTPRASMRVEAWECSGSSGSMRRPVWLDYEIPLKRREGRPPHQRFKALNWPPHVTAGHVGADQDMEFSAKSWLLRQFAKRQMPLGTESKYRNTLAFFEHSMKQPGSGTHESR